MAASVSWPRIAKGVGIVLFAALFLLGFMTSMPSPKAGAIEWLRVVAKSFTIAAIGSTGLVALLAVWAAGAWVWFKTWKAFGHVPRWRYGWILSPEGLSDEEQAARRWLLRVYGTLIVVGLLMGTLERYGGLQ